MPDMSCPSCGAALPLRHAGLPYATCGQCLSLVLREGDGVREVGKSAVLPDDVSPVQLGMTGMAGDERFSVAGRVRWGWADGSWNEWLLAMADGSYRWLGDAMGQFLLLTEAAEVLEEPVAKAFAEGGAIAPGARIVLGELDFAASDVKEARCLGSEGDLPFPTPADWTMVSVDFRSPEGAARLFAQDPCPQARSALSVGPT